MERGNKIDENRKSLRFVSGRSHPELAEDIAKKLGIQIAGTEIYDFANGEIYIQVSKSIRESDVFVFQTYAEDINKQIMEQLIMIDALKRASARRVYAVVPCLPYARQDKKHRSREPISARLLCDLYTIAGANRVLTVDLHSPQIQGFVNFPIDHIDASAMLVNYFKENYSISNIAVISPDAGRTKVASQWAKALGDAPLGFVHKTRSITEPNVSKAGVVVGDVKGKDCVITDDIIDTGRTICDATDALLKQGASSVTIIATHAIFSGNAVNLLKNSGARNVIVTDTVPIPDKKRFERLIILSSAELIAPVIDAVFAGKSVGSFMNEGVHNPKVIFGQ